MKNDIERDTERYRASDSDNRQTTTLKTIDYYRQAIPAALHAAQEETGIDAKTCSQNNWCFLLLKIREKCIDKKDLKQFYGHAENMPYDIDLLNDIADIYISICYENNKIISLYEYCYMIGVDIDIILEYEKGRRQKITVVGASIYKKLLRGSENSLRNSLNVKGSNPVGILALLNHDFSYNLPGVSQEIVRPRLSIAEIRQKIGLLSDNTVPTDTIENT